MPEPQSPGSRRGLFSCLHSRCDDASNPGFQGTAITEALTDLIDRLYAEAFDRLPSDDLGTDRLLTTMRSGGGICVGLLDPVSNIILNTISVLPPRDSRRYNLRKTPERKRLAGAVQPDDIWSGIGRLSCHSLVRFLVSYFGCLTDQQAARYLHWACADLALAVLLVEHDLYAAAEPQLPNPASERTQAALKRAATCARHHAPDVLVRLHTSPLPQNQLLAAVPFLSPGGRNLTLGDVNTVIQLLRYQETASLDFQFNLLPHGKGVVVYGRDFSADEGKLIHTTSSVNNFGVFTIMVERHGDRFASLRGKQSSSISTMLENASQGSSSLKSCGDACEYTESLRMRLHGMIHAFYLKVFTMLPSDVLRGLMRYILFAGHCYGPMDPVSNIIISSIWHSMFFPLPSAGSDSQAYDILDTLSMLRVEVRSLNGLIALVKANSDCSMQQAMEYLCSNSCHMSQAMSTPHGFHTAAEAAQHPQHAALGSFLSSLTPHMLANLRPFLSINNGTHSSETLHQVRFILANELRQTAVQLPPKEAQMCKVAKDTLLIKRSEYKNMRLFIRSELAEVLKKYASEHPQEPKYEPSVICGVVESYYSDRDSYHVNFVAASESGDDNQLFFAELNVTCDQSKPSFCLRLRLTDMGRCYYGQTSSIKIMYPASSDYFETDITSYGIKHTEMMLDADFVFDFRRDEQFAKDAVKYCEDWKAFLELDVV
ncbi:uncharacterized protein LOC124662130 [Lolium rigidum]|uniref:uncharacterized protein LOC124662130 n=1 Tax=Lolium rigidum TaxID=89674 RepID=UPI001F5D05ED|nr:uncharacterized protein LOC124662130 [Lolium rigidum]